MAENNMNASLALGILGAFLKMNDMHESLEIKTKSEFVDDLSDKVDNDISDEELEQFYDEIKEKLFENK